MSSADHHEGFSLLDTYAVSILEVHTFVYLMLDGGLRATIPFQLYEMSDFLEPRKQAALNWRSEDNLAEGTYRLVIGGE